MSSAGVAFFISVILLLYVWVFYPLFVGLASFLIKNKKRIKNEELSYQLVSVVIAAHNEAKNLRQRVINITDSSYPSDKIEIIIASDGSSDNTSEIINEMSNDFHNIKFIDIHPQIGRAGVHNKAIENSDGDVVVFTDAETQFDDMFLCNIMSVFSDDKIGFASGVLKYRNINSGEVTKSVGLYWRAELWLRTMESNIGVYILGSGACCAVRRLLYIDIPSTGDVDFTTPIDVVLQGYKCLHVSDAIAYDALPDTPESEFRARVRMTAKNIYGTIRRWGMMGAIMHPIYSIVLLSHKIGRWLTPFFMIIAIISNLFLLTDDMLFVVFFGAQFTFYALAFAGYLGLPVPYSGQAYSFLLANAAFFVGVILALSGRVPKLYTPASQM